MNELLQFAGVVIVLLAFIGGLAWLVSWSARESNKIPLWTCTRCRESYRAPYESAGDLCDDCRVAVRLEDLASGMESILAEVRRERVRQDAKWGEQNHDDSGWALILGEEFGEVQKAVLEVRFGYYGANPDYIREELVQLTAVAVAWLECIDRREP